jgi:LPS export ABC transporter protein LptC
VTGRGGVGGALTLLAVSFVACEGAIKPTATMAAADSADQVLFGMSHYVTTDGIQRARVRADTAYFFTPVQSAELRAVHITFYDPHGAETSTLTSHEGTYHWRSGDMEARGNVIVVRTDGATLRTEVLHYSQAKNQVFSEKPFIFDEPTRHIEGDGFTSDPDFRVVTATRPHGAGGKFTLPNQ